MGKDHSIILFCHSKIIPNVNNTKKVIILNKSNSINNFEKIRGNNNINSKSKITNKMVMVKK